MSKLVPDEVISALKKIKFLGIIAGIIMIVLGIIMFFNPISGASIFIWLMVAGLLVYGIINIIMYCKMPVGIRDGSNLGLGVLWVIIAILLIICGIGSSVEAGWAFLATFQTFIAIMVGFTCLFNAINAFCTCGEVEAMGISPVGNIISGILLIIAGILILTAPFSAAIAMWVLFGLFGVIGGISLICRVSVL